MGLFSGGIGRIGAGIATGGWSELAQKNPFGIGGGTNSTSPGPWNPITANNTAIPADLAATMGTIGTNAYDKIGSNYGAAAKKLQGDATARGMNPAAVTAPGSYAGQRLATTQGLDVGNLESALGGQIGGTAYSNALANRDYGQQSDLASQIAALNRPNTLQQIFQGIGAVGKPVATYAGLKSMQGRGGGGDSSGYGVGGGELPSDLSLIPGGSASAYYRQRGAY